MIAVNVPLPEFLNFVSEVVARYPFIWGLIIFIGLDIVGGLLLAIHRRALNSAISGKGMIKKAYMLLLCAAGLAIQPYTEGIPVGKLIAGGFIITEFISIVENARALGLPVPEWLGQWLDQRRAEEQRKAMQKMNITPIAKVDVPQGVKHLEVEIQRRPDNETNENKS